MAAKIVKYEHHETVVSVMAKNRGKHRANCLCFQGCENFHPGERNNCPLAKTLYEFCVRNGMVTPVWECPEYKTKETESDPVVD